MLLFENVVVCLVHGKGWAVRIIQSLCMFLTELNVILGDVDVMKDIQCTRQIRSDRWTPC
jgi:hypothetical protein